MPNPKGALVDGQLVRILVEIGTPEEKVVVPQSALIADQQGIYVFVVEDGKAAVRRIKVGGESGADVVVEQGLSGGEQVIVEGLQGVRPGAAVLATPLTANHRRELTMLSAVFVDRPRLAIVIALVTTIAGLVALFSDSDRAVSRHRSAAGLGHHALSRRIGSGSWMRPSPSRSKRRSSASTR